MSSFVPKVAAIHDMSGLGRCSITVIMPVLASMGIQTCPLPTAILSSHSGGFGMFSFHDLTDTMEDYAGHWKQLGVAFNCIYSGFLGSERQIDIVSNIIKDLKQESEQLVVVDPVMGDNGRIYKTYTEAMKEKMSLLVSVADIITPNLTEACFLLKEEYCPDENNITKVKQLLVGLTNLGPSMAVITGVKLEGNKYYNLAYNRLEGAFYRVGYKNLPVTYPGTGDIFTSVLIGAMLKGAELPIALAKATGFLSVAVEETYGYNTDPREGVLLELVLGELHKDTCKVGYETF